MKKLILLSTILFLSNCNKKNENQIVSKTTSQNEDEISQEEIERIVDSAANAADYQAEKEIYGENSKVKEAKNILDEANAIVKKGILKQMSTAEVNKKVNPLMAKYEKILAELSPKEQEQVKNYRIVEINKVIDLQVQNQ